MTLAELFPDDDYKFQLRFERGVPADFFAATARHAALIVERQHWLRSEPEKYSALLPGGEVMAHEVCSLAGEWNGLQLPDSARSPRDGLLGLGEFWEMDFLLLLPESKGEIRLLGGCLCFPSSWRLTDKIGHPIECIHSPVPGLNTAIGAGIHKFLANLKPGAAWLRHNWGLTRSAEMNHHPDRKLPRLDETVCRDDVWLRVEHQALVALPASGGILFGIQVMNHALSELKADSLATRRLIHLLETMPEAMAVYKGIAPARKRILQLLAS